MGATESVRAEHEKLQILGDRLRAIAACPAEAIPKRRWRRLLVGDVAVFAALLSARLAREEDSGFFDEIADHSPRLARRAEALCSEHDVLRAMLDRAVASVGDMRDADAVRANLRALLDKLETHERAEWDLAQDAYLTDEGGQG